MTRLIKFRAWDKEIKVMRSWVQERSGNQPLGHFFTRQDYELMQFTGLLDKNGKEIYEGDICKMGWEGHEIIAPMIWNSEKAQFGLDATVDFESPEHIKDVPTRPEVIGNIYENPELLK